MVINKDGKIEMINAVAEKLTGWDPEDALGRHYKDVFVLSHEQSGVRISDPFEAVLATGKIQELGDHAILTSKAGAAYYVEDSAAPVKDNTGATVGVVLVFRDVTDKKIQRKKIEYLSFHDALTGLYNRRFFEEELRRIDTERNLPISVIMGDVNGLKLTNDIFGHESGDMLLAKVAEVLQNVCRADDIIARWGGDEFVLLLPGTGYEETRKIVARIRNEFAKRQIKPVKCSISMGFDVKLSAAEDIAKTINYAEEKMYLAKTFEKVEVEGDAIEAIISTLHEKNAWEKGHADRVSELCQKLGRALKLSEAEIRKLREAGYLHDIGKIVIAPELLKRNFQLSCHDRNEMKKHAAVGYRILNSFGETMDIAHLVLAHHERWDGTGYPKGLRGDEIPLLARIISVADSYDHMAHDATHNIRRAEAVRMIRENAGKCFDPQIAELLQDCVTV